MKNFVVRYALMGIIGVSLAFQLVGAVLVAIAYTTDDDVST